MREEKNHHRLFLPMGTFLPSALKRSVDQMSENQSSTWIIVSFLLSARKPPKFQYSETWSREKRVAYFTFSAVSEQDVYAHISGPVTKSLISGGTIWFFCGFVWFGEVSARGKDGTLTFLCCFPPFSRCRDHRSPHLMQTRCLRV